MEYHDFAVGRIWAEDQAVYKHVQPLKLLELGLGPRCLQGMEILGEEWDGLLHACCPAFPDSAGSRAEGYSFRPNSYFNHSGNPCARTT